jgi:hypothetical protein
MLQISYRFLSRASKYVNNLEISGYVWSQWLTFWRVRRFGAEMFAESACPAVSADSALGLITLAPAAPNVISKRPLADHQP